MAKHIQVKTFEPAGFNKGLVKILSQTHRGNNFGENGSKTFTTSNGITLGSNNRPARDADDYDTIWLRGHDYCKDEVTIGVPAKRLQKVKEAVAEYNEYFSDSAIYARQREAAIEAAFRRQEAARRAALAAANACCEIVG